MKAIIGIIFIFGLTTAATGLARNNGVWVFIAMLCGVVGWALLWASRL